PFNRPLFNWPPFNWRSPLISALGLSLLLRTDHIATMAIAAAMAIASKFVFKANNKHFFNPANFGIITALVLTQDAWISPGQWGEELWYGLIFLGAGGIVLKRVGRWDTTVMFLGSYACLEAARNFYLGWTWDVWAHRMSSGSLLLFALFMVTDPRSIPNARGARLGWAGAIALLTYILRNQFYLTTAVFWALFLLAPLTILLDKAWAAPRFEWRKLLMWQQKALPTSVGTSLGLVCAVSLVSFFSFTPPAHAFCGFYVARADTELYNKASQVAIARDGNHTVLTMANDYQGDTADLAMVVPVPTIIQQEQVAVANPAIIEHLDSFSAPRLVEYFDSDPCQVMRPLASVSRSRLNAAPVMAPADLRQAADLGVTIEEQFSVGEYDILILSATESDGLETWLTQNNYRIPTGAREVLAPYIRQGMKFFVAKVNLEEQSRSDYQQLRPLQIEFDSPRFMLPIRLGMLNAEAEQDLVVYLLSPEGRAELTNYRTVNIPTDVELPLFVQDEFGEFYPEMFQRSYEAANKNVAFLEYAWNMQGCDPCSSPPLNREELLEAGAFWLKDNASNSNAVNQPNRGRPSLAANSRAAGNSAFITRLHVRYSRDTFPEDLMFQSTTNQQTFQGRYVTNHPFAENIDCAARLARPQATVEEAPQGRFSSRAPGQPRTAMPAIVPELTPEAIEEAVARQQQYMKDLANRFEREAKNLASLTGQNIQTIHQRISDEVPQPMPSLWLLQHPKST
ncbi:MAG: DUF2330 domain-containing protein, partial [Cyanobacteria bacterium J06598_3]